MEYQSMTKKQLRYRRRLEKKIARATVTEGVKHEVYKIAHMRDWFLVFLIISGIGNIVLGILLFMNR